MRTSSWRRLHESTEGPTVTISIPREWAEELLRALATSLEIGDEGMKPDEAGLDHMEPDEDDMPGGEPDGDFDDVLGLDGLGGLEDGGGDAEDDDEPAGDADDEDGADDDEDEEDDDEKDEAAEPGHGYVDFAGSDRGTRPRTAFGESRSAWAIAEKHIGFKKLKGELSHEKGVRNPGALAASIGRKKFGAKAFNKKAAAGRK